VNKQLLPKKPQKDKATFAEPPGVYPTTTTPHLDILSTPVSLPHDNRRSPFITIATKSINSEYDFISWVSDFD
jgi:hypothetical protein